MKISVSLPEEDVAFLDSMGVGRSAALHQAVQALRLSNLTEDYDAAFADFALTGESAAWDGTTGDGIAA